MFHLTVLPYMGTLTSYSPGVVGWGLQWNRECSRLYQLLLPSLLVVESVLCTNASLDDQVAALHISGSRTEWWKVVDKPYALVVYESLRGPLEWSGWLHFLPVAMDFYFPLQCFFYSGSECDLETAEMYPEKASHSVPNPIEVVCFLLERL